MLNKKYNRMIVKMGSNVLTQANGLPDLAHIGHLVDQIAALKKEGREVVLVSSGAVASGRSLIQVDERANVVTARQLLASVGQVKLIGHYSELFKDRGLVCAQVLVTKEDFRSRGHYLNMKNCLEILLSHGVIPVINENDVVSVTELMFTDNDELAGLMASILDAQALIILTNVDGIYDKDPKAADARVIEKISADSPSLTARITSTKSDFGRGGMRTKYAMAQQVAKLGIHVHIANGRRQHVLTDLIAGRVIHTYFEPQKPASQKKRWIAHSGTFAKGVVEVNSGACEALHAPHAVSLLPVGVEKIKSDFRKGDIVKLIDSNGSQVGLGIAEYGSDKLADRIGKRQQRPLVHYNYLYLNN